MNLEISLKELAKMTPEERDSIREMLIERLNDLERRKREIKASDPFMFFVPSSGDLSPAHKEFLAKYLRPEDIPDRVDSQLDSLICDAPIILTAGGNQSGKTTRGVIEDYIDITHEVPYALQDIYPKSKIPEKWPFQIRTVGVDHKTFLNNLLPIYQYWAPRRFLKNNSWEDSFSSEHRTLSLYSPDHKDKVIGTIEFMTNAQDVESFQGPPRDKVNYDEEPRLEIYKENLMRFVTADRLRIRFNMTPTRGLTWVKTEILDKGQDEKGNAIRAFKIATVGNPRANLDVVKEINEQSTASYEELKMRLLGEFISLGGLVYGNLFNRSTHIIQPFTLSYYDHIVYRGLDPHLVKPTHCVEVAVDREGIAYVIGRYSQNADTDRIKSDLAERAQVRGYRLGQTRCDKSADSSITVLGGKNIFRELGRGQNAIPALITTDKFPGSIAAGVDTIKQYLKPHPATGKPRLYFFDTPEVWQVVKAVENLEREKAPNEDRKGVRDKIDEGRHDDHACLRYIFQGPLVWLPPTQSAPERTEERYI